MLLTLTGFIALIVLVKVLVFDPWDGFAIETPIGQAPSDVMAQAANFGDEITLLGFDITPQRVDAGQMLDVKLIWQAQRPLSVTYQSFVHLVYPEGKILGQSDHLNPGGFPTNLWPLDRYIIDHHKIRIPADVDAGAYLISVGLYDLETGHRIPVRSAACGYRPDSVVLCNIVSLAR